MNAVVETVKGIFKGSQDEDYVTSAIEGQTAKIPSSLFLVAALGSIGASLVCQMTGRKALSNFIGHWAPTFLILGLYNKTVKQHGH